MPLTDQQVSDFAEWLNTHAEQCEPDSERENIFYWCHDELLERAKLQWQGPLTEEDAKLMPQVEKTIEKIKELFPRKH